MGRSLGDSNAESQELLKEVFLAKANELHRKLEEETRQRDGLQVEINSFHRCIYEKLDEHSAMASNLQRQVENNERSMREKFNDQHSTQQSLQECTQRLANNQKSMDDRVNHLIVGRNAATDRTTTIEEVKAPMSTVNFQSLMVQGSPFVQVRHVTAS